MTTIAHTMIISDTVTTLDPFYLYIADRVCISFKRQTTHHANYGYIRHTRHNDVIDVPVAVVKLANCFGMT